MSRRALEDAQVERIRWMYANTSNSMEKIGRHFGVSQGVIQHVINRTGAYKLTKGQEEFRAMVARSYQKGSPP